MRFVIRVIRVYPFWQMVRCARMHLRATSACLLLATLLMSCSTGHAPMPIDDGSPPVRGGTLLVVGESDVDHLSTTGAYTANSIWLLRTFARQLVSYPVALDFEQSSRLVPDLATELPTRENGGISPDGRVYRFHLRKGVRWNTTPPRDVTAHDAVLGMKMLCNPVNPSGAPGYYLPTIVGLQDFCDRFAKIEPTVDAIQKYVSSTAVPGVEAEDDYTVVYRLNQPASDFLNLIAMPFASPMPVEYLNYLPDSPEARQHTISNGPYRITKYTAKREIELERNPVWDPQTDPERPAYVDHIRMRFGIDQQLDQLQLEAGTADLSFDHQTPTADLAALLEYRDPNVILAPPGDYFAQMVYLVINMVGPNNNGALKNAKVRQALQYAVDKTAVAQLWGGPSIAKPLRQAVVSSATGHDRQREWYATPGDRGDAARARKLLTEAGFPNGIRLNLLYPQNTAYPLAAQSLQESLQKAGFEVQITSSTTADFWSSVLPSAENAQRGTWDVAITSWIPDWFGTNGRSVIQPIFDGRTFGNNTMDYGGYNNADVNREIDLAIAADSEAAATQHWAAAAAQVMDDAAMVPLVETKFHFYRSARTRNCRVHVFGLNCDLNAIWLKDAKQP